MIKTLSLLLRGSTAAATADLADRHALPLLDQQMRDAETALLQARRALAVVRAEDAGEATRLAVLLRRIAELEADIDAAQAARAPFGAEIARLQAAVGRDIRRFAALERGRWLARAAEAVRVVRRGRIEPAEPGQGSLSGAEALLARLRRPAPADGDRS